MSTTPTPPPLPVSAGGEALPPNHHAHHPGFSGVGGAVAAIAFTIGRGAAAELAVDLTGAGPGDDVVDIGCGPGVAVRHAAARRASSVVGVDPAVVMLRFGRALTRARRRDAAKVRFLNGTAEALPLPDGAASVAWSLATVHHWHDLDAGLAEVRRVLRPAGRFLVLERRAAPGRPASPATAGPRSRPSSSPSAAAPPASPASRSTATRRAAAGSTPSSPTPPPTPPPPPRRRGFARS